MTVVRMTVSPVDLHILGASPVRSLCPLGFAAPLVDTNLRTRSQSQARFSVLLLGQGRGLRARRARGARRALSGSCGPFLLFVDNSKTCMEVQRVGRARNGLDPGPEGP